MRTHGELRLRIALDVKYYWDAIQFLKDCMEFDTEARDIRGLLDLFMEMGTDIGDAKGVATVSCLLRVNFENIRSYLNLLQDCMKDDEDNKHLKNFSISLKSIQECGLQQGFSKKEVYGED